MKTYYNYISYFLLFISLFSYAQDVDKMGYISFPKCEKVEEKEIQSCNIYELKQFMANHIVYPKKSIKKGYEGEVMIKYMITAKGELKSFLLEKNKIHPSLDAAALQLMEKLQTFIDVGTVKIIPAQLDGKLIDSYYKFPVLFKITDKDRKQPSISDNKKMIIATYRTSEKTIQFRRDLEGNIYSYSLTPEGEKLEIKIDGNTEPNLLPEKEQSFFFLYNLTFLKPEVLLTFGKIEGKEYEIFIDKNFNKEKGDISPKDAEVRINIYSIRDSNNPIEVFNTIDELFNSKYAILLFK